MSICMLVLPPIFAWAVHNFLYRNEMKIKAKTGLLAMYALVVNICTFAVSYVRGVKGLRFTDMTITYKAKYLSLGCVFGLVIPFIVCLIMGEHIAAGDFRNYLCRLGHDTKKYFSFAVHLAKADLHEEVANSVLNWLWWMIEPVCMMIIYAAIFGLIFNAAELYYPVFIFMGLAMWNFFARSISSSIGTIQQNRSIITKVYIPKYMLLFSRMLVYLFKMEVSFGVAFIMMIFLRVPFTLKILFFIPITAALFLFTFGLGCILLHYGVYLTDLNYAVGIVLNMLMYLAGVFYNIQNQLPAPFGELLEKFNPIAFFMADMRRVLLYGQHPDWTMLGMWTVVSCVLIMLGVFTIYRNENAYVKVI